MGLKNLLFGFLWVISSFGLEASSSLSYSGRLVNTDGSPVTGPVNLKFELAYTNSSGVGQTLCDQLIEGVPLTNGVFHVKLSFSCPSSSITKVLSATPAGESAAIRVTNETSGKTYPYQSLHPLPYSQVSNQLTQMGAVNGQVLTWNGSEWAPANGATTDGTVKSILTGSGLIGGPITDSGTISIAPGGVLDTHLASGIDPAKLSGTRDSSNYLKGDNTWSSFSGDVLETILIGFSTATSAVVNATDTLVVALGKIQAQLTNKIDKTGGTLSIGTIDGVPTPVLPSQVVNKQYVDDAIGGVGASQWTTAVNDIFYNTGNVGIGTSTPATKLDVSGGVQISKANTHLVLKDTDEVAGEFAYIERNSTALIFGTNDGATSTIGLTVKDGNVEVAGQVKITGGTPGAGKILTSDASGLASWTDPTSTTPTGAAGGDLSGTYPDPTIASGAITDAKVAVGANIDQAKIANLTTDLGNKQATDSDLTALAGLGTTGVLVRTGTGSATTRSIVGTANRVSVTNGDGVSGDPTINISSTLLPSPVAGDAGKILKAAGADTTSWESLLSSDVTTALGFTPINKAGDSIISGVFDFSGTSVVRVLDPVLATDVANKQYVDAQVAAGGSGDFMKDGSVAMTGAFKAANGTAGAPSISFSSETNTGFYYMSPTQVGWSANGGVRFYFGTSIVSANTGGAGITSANGTATKAAFFFQGDANTGMFSPTLETVGFTTNGAEKMRITSTGDVGIGTTSPNAKLDVRTTAPGNAMAVWQLAADPTSSSHGLYASNRPSFTANSTIWSWGNSVETYPLIATGVSQTGVIGGYYSKAMRNMVSGDGDGSLNFLYGIRSEYGHGNAAAISPTTTATYGLYINPYIQSGTIANMYDIYLAPDNVGGTATNRFGIYQGNTAKNYFAGNIGIGTTTPAYKLDVNGAINATSVLVNGVAVGTGGTQWSNGAGGVISYSGGSVGIGTTSPQGNGLHINSSSTWTGTKYTTAGTGATETDGVRFGYDEGFGGFIWNREATGLVIATNNLERLRVNSSGNVGIGTTTPGATLEVAGQVKITGGTPGVGKVLTSDGSGLATWETPVAGGISTLTGDVTASGSGSVAATIANNAVTTGKILNGTILNEDIANTTIAYGKLNLADLDIPVAKLARVNCTVGEVLTSDITLGYRCVADDSTDSTKVPLAGGTMTGALILAADPTIALGAATKQYVDGLVTSAASSGTNTSVQISNGSGGFNSSTWFNFSSGKLGVGPGTTTPTNQLTVISNGDDVPVAKFQNGDSRGAGIEVKATNTGGADFWIQATADNADEGGGKLSFRDRKNADASRMVIDSVGNVGIGTTTPGAKLDINGDISVNSSYESASAYVNSSTAYTVPDTQVNIRRITLTANTTLTLPAFTSPSTKVYTLTIFLKQDAIGSHTVSFEGDGADTIIWDANTAPTIASTSNKITILQFTKVSDESVWYASMVWKGE